MPPKGTDRRAAERRWARWLSALGVPRHELNPLQRTDRSDDEGRWLRTVRLRASVLLVVLALWGVVLVGQLVRLQVVMHDALAERATAQQGDFVTLDPVRGDITDRHGRLLASSVAAESIGIHPRRVRNREYTIAAVCAALGDCTGAERKALLEAISTRTRFTYVRRARAVLPEQVDRVKALGLPGVVTEPAVRRYYPARDLAAHVLGFVNLDNAGAGGLELTLDRHLKGEPGRALVQVDANLTRIDSIVQRDPVPGAVVELTLDLDAQHIVERELARTVKEHNAKAATAIVMDPETGEILAFANVPSFDPNLPWNASDDARRNRGTQEAYEPGSTFKIVTAAAALEEGVASPTEIIDTTPGLIRIPGRAKPIEDDHPIGVATFEKVVVFSSNVGAVKLGQRLGIERFSRYVERFGFGQLVSPIFAGSSLGLWSPKTLDMNGLASASMGYQIGVTPLQMVTAVNAVANGGRLLEPHVIRAVVRDGHREPVAPKEVRRVLSPATVDQLNAMLEGVVAEGTAKSARIEGFRAAGKTGTAKKAIPGGYSSTDYNASFVGYVPSRRPAFTILVVVDTPRGGTIYGGSVAAPAFKRIAEALLLRAGIQPTTYPEPALVVRAGGPSRFAERDRPVSLVPVTVTSDASLMPDVRGLGAREALAVLQRAGVFVRLHGHGLVRQQTPGSGSVIEPGSWATLELSRDTPVPGGRP